MTAVKELEGIKDKAIIIYENMIPKRIKGEFVYPKAYLEEDVKALIKSIKHKALKEFIMELEQLRDNTDYGLVDVIETIKSNHKKELSKK